MQRQPKASEVAFDKASFPQPTKIVVLEHAL
jgi:hypothetical protein